MAARVFAVGHLGKLTRIVPFELADAVLEEEGGLERRARLAPSRAGLCFLLATCLFPRAAEVIAVRLGARRAVVSKSVS